MNNFRRFRDRILFVIESNKEKKIVFDVEISKSDFYTIRASNR